MIRRSSLIACLVLAGCWGHVPGRPETHPVSGSVFFRDRPAAGAHVQFFAEGNLALVGLCPHGVVGPDGALRLTTFVTGDGAPAGNYAVTLTWPEPPKPGQEDEGPDRFRGRYADPRKPLRVVTIAAGANDLGRFDLK